MKKKHNERNTLSVILKNARILLLTIVLLAMIMLAYFIHSSNNTYDKLNDIENNNYHLYYDNDNDLILEYNRANCYYKIYNNQGVEYHMHVKRGLGRYLFVSFYEDDNVIFTGSMRITKDEQIIIESDNERYKIMVFSKQWTYALESENHSEINEKNEF